MSAAVRAELASFARATEAVAGEVDVPLTVAEGTLPADLRGVLYRNGPGKPDVFGEKYGHPFDGDGMITRFSFDGAAVRYRNRFVRTREYLEEERAGRMLYRSFGTNLPGGLRKNFLRLRFKNAANTSVVFHGGRLFALWEGGLPHEIDPVTLETRGRHDFRGRLRNTTSLLGRLLSPELPFSAHPKLDVATGDLLNFGTLLGKENQLVTYRVAPDGRMDVPGYTPIGALSFVHDFVLTERYAVFFLSAVAFRVAATLFGLASPVDSLTTSDTAPSRIVLVPRSGGAPVTVPARPGFIFHFANGYEDGEGRVILDGMRMDRLPPAADVRRIFEGREAQIPKTLPTRMTVDLAQRTVSESPLGEQPADLPTIDPRRTGRPYRHFWAIAGGAARSGPLFTQVLHFDHAGPARARDFAPDFPGEPVFVPRSADAAEDDGYLLCLVYRSEAHRSDLYVLRPEDLGTVCRLELPHHVPPGFHGTWVAAERSPADSLRA